MTRSGERPCAFRATDFPNHEVIGGVVDQRQELRKLSPDDSKDEQTRYDRE
jgi:hypothetical protein